MSDLECAVELLEALKYLDGHFHCGIRQPQVKYEIAYAVAERINSALSGNPNFSYIRSWQPRPRAPQPSWTTYLEQHPELLIDEREMKAVGAYSHAHRGYNWLRGAILLLEAHDHLRRINIEKKLKNHTRLSRQNILEGFQHYILIFLGRGKATQRLFGVDFQDMHVPDLDMIRRKWEDGNPLEHAIRKVKEESCQLRE